MKNQVPLIDECCLCLDNHKIKECSLLKTPIVINDTITLSKAYATLPTVLCIEKTCDGKEIIKSKSLLSRGTRFGPLDSKIRSHTSVDSDFPLKIVLDTDEFEYLDTEDGTVCNWMCLVQPASCFQDCNLVAYQSEFQIYFSVLRDIKEQSVLKVYYSPFYAEKMGVKFTRSNELDNIGHYTDYDEVMFDDEPLGPNDYMEGINEIEGVPSTPSPATAHVATTVGTLDVTKLSGKSLGVPKDKEEWACSMCSDVIHTIPDFAKHLLKHYVTDKDEGNLLAKSNENVGPNSNLVSSDVFYVPNANGLNNLTSTLSTVPTTLTLGDELQVMSDLNLSFMNPSVPLLYLFTAPNRTLDQVSSNSETDPTCKPKLVCDICGKQFSSVKNIKRHLKKHTGDFCCAKCGKVFARKETLKIHECVDLKYECDQCPAIFTRVKQFREHRTRHLKQTGKYKMSSLSCNLCSYESDTLLNLIHHIRDHFTKELILESIDCPICNQTYTRLKVFFNFHLKHHESNVYCKQCKGVYASSNSYDKHACLNPVNTNVEMLREKPKTKMSRQAYHPQVPGPVIKARFTCDICFSHFDDKEEFQLHRNKHEESNLIKSSTVMCSHCGKSYDSNTGLRIHINRMHGSKITCSEPSCKKQINTQDEFLLHIQSHKDKDMFGSTPISYPCTFCSKVFRLKKYRTRHIKIKHAADYRFHCHLCEEKFKDKHYLNSHVKNKHSNKPRVRVSNYTYSCHLCKRSFAKKSTLRKHITSHSQVVSYACSFCPKVVVRAKRMQSHLLMSHADKKSLWNSQEFFNTLRIIKDLSSLNTGNNLLLDGTHVPTHDDLNENGQQNLGYHIDNQMPEYYSQVNETQEYQTMDNQVQACDNAAGHYIPNEDNLMMKYPSQDNQMDYNPVQLNDMDHMDNLLTEDPIKLFDINSDSNAAIMKQARELPVDSINNFDLSVFYSEPSAEVNTEPVPSVFYSEPSADVNTDPVPKESDVLVTIPVSTPCITNDLSLTYKLPAVSINPQLCISDSCLPLHTIQTSDIQLSSNFYSSLPVPDMSEGDNLLYVIMDHNSLQCDTETNLVTADVEPSILNTQMQDFT